MKADKLKPCPFCQGEAMYSSQKYHASCKNRLCGMYRMWMTVYYWNKRKKLTAYNEKEN